MAKDIDEDRVFSLDMGSGDRLSVYVMGEPHNYRVLISDPDRDGMISIAKCDWVRIVERVKGQFE